MDGEFSARRLGSPSAFRYPVTEICGEGFANDGRIGADPLVYVIHRELQAVCSGPPG